MTHEEKVNYMKIATAIVGYGFDEKGIDSIISVYELVLKRKGRTNIEDIIDVKHQISERDEQRKKDKIKSELEA